MSVPKSLFGRAMLRFLFLMMVFGVVSVLAQQDPDKDDDGGEDEDPSDFSASSSTTLSRATRTTSTLTTVVSIFYLDVKGEDQGLPYTMFHQVSGSVIGVDPSATTFVVTPTLSDQRQPERTRRGNMTTNIPTLRRNTASWHQNSTQRPSTMTQGPETFLFTGSGYGGESRTLINRCSLNGTSSATCNLTHVGAGWYTERNPDWNGTFSTYNYSWTSGDSFGFAPVTITDGAEMMPPPTATSTSNGAAAALALTLTVGEVHGVRISMGLLVALGLGVFAML